MKSFMYLALLIILSVALTALLPKIAFAATTTDTINVTLTVTRSTQGGGGGGGGGCPPDCPPPATSTPIIISNVISSPGATTAAISWDTNVVSIGTVEWGLTQAFELGSQPVTTPGSSHVAIITGLQEGTTYYFRINASEFGNSTNSNSETGIFNTRDSIPPANPIPFDAVYNPATGFIDLSWRNPSDIDFAAVRLVRSTVFYPTNENEGELVYDGSAQNFVDTRVTGDTWYYYTLFARDRSGNYSSGVISRAFVPPTQDDDIPEPLPPAVVDDPFSAFSTTTDPLINAIDLFYFKIIQDGRVTRFTDGTVQIDGSRPFTIAVDYDKLPEILKTIAVTLKKPGDPKKTFSFLLRVDSEKKEYSATIAPLGIAGTYPLFVTIIDFKNQGIRRFSGALDVTYFNIVTVPASTKSVIKKVTPIGTAVGIAAGITQIVTLAFNINSLYDLYLLVLRFIGFLLGFFGFKKKSKPWGTVYDSVTKRPLDPAYLTVKRDGEEVADAITDLDGRYGFLLPKGTYHITANKTHYEFPSKKLAGKSKDEIYENLYFGEPLPTNEGEIIGKNIPLDPVGFDWNEFVKNKKNLFKVFTRKEKIKTFIYNSLYVVGFASTALAFVVTPNLFNSLVLGFYVILFVLQIFWKYKHRAISIIDSENREPLPFAIIRLFLPGSNQEVKAVVADEWGRFYALVSPGKYYLTVERKNSDGSYAKVYQSPIMNLRKGVLSDDIEVDPNMVMEQSVRSFI